MLLVQEERDKMIRENLGLVHSCAHRFKGRGIEYEDLFQAGCMGLIKATDAFDENRGVRFSTYAVPVILGEMRRLFRDGGSVKVSRTLKELSLKTVRAKERLSVREGREPTVGELARELGVEPEQVVEALNVSAPPLSLTEGEEEGAGQIDIPVESPEEALSDSLALRQQLSGLEERDRALIRLRYYGGKTQVQTAEILGMTQVQVSRREKKILTRLRGEMGG
ncbi:MAG: sigma-70 family RNA polymerase sigma factor [Oscillospiraceae bacterium]|nr:sigma-70 family RNA polymerase sigma factor [Oscillospiraceae bacterium]